MNRDMYWWMMHLKEYVLAQEMLSRKWVLHSLLRGLGILMNKKDVTPGSFGNGFLNLNQIEM